MLDGNELKFGDLLVEKGKECNSLFMFLSYIASRSNIKLLKIPSDIYIPSVPVWKPDYESFLDSRYVRDHGFFRPILNMNYADPDLIKKHNDKANHYLNLGKWLYNCSLYPKINSVDEWLNSDAAKREALKFKNGCYFISSRGCGKTAMMNDIFERLKSQNEPNIRYLRQKFDDVDATNAIKEFINKQYGANSFGRAVPDDSLDALRYALPTVERIREEFMMDLLYEGYVSVIDHGLGDDCINMYVRAFANCVSNGKNYVKFNFYRRSDINPTYTIRFTNPTFSWGEHEVCDACQETTNGKLIWQVLVQSNQDFLAKCKYWFTTKYGSSVNRDLLPKNMYKSIKNFGVGTYITNRTRISLVGEYYCIKECYLNPEHKEGKIKARLRAFRKPDRVSMDEWARTVEIRSKEYIQKYYGMNERTLIYYIYDDGRVEIPCWEFVEDNADYPHKVWNAGDFDGDVLKKEEETKEMNNNILKGSFNSKLYMIRNGSEDLSYLGTVMGMSIDHVVGCELAGKIDFVADDEPVKKLQYFNREFIKNVVFNDPATIVEWKDGTKTVVQARDGEKFDPEKGLAMAIAKKAMGNKRDYYHVFKHYLKKVKTESAFGENTKTVIVPAEIADDVMQYIADTFCEKIAKKNDLKETIKSMPDELYYDNQAIDLKDFKEDSENDLVTFKCSKADAERIRGFITRPDESSNDVRIIPETIEEVKRYEEDK